MRRSLAMLAAGGLLAISATAVVAADVPLHQHTLTTPSGNEVQFALGICRNQLQTPMNNLHANVHLGSPGEAWADNGFGLRIALC